MSLETTDSLEKREQNSEKIMLPGQNTNSPLE